MVLLMGFIMVIFQVSSVFVDKARWGTVYPKEVPYLQRIQPKDPISLETLGHVRTPEHLQLSVFYQTTARRGAGFPWGGA